MACNGMPCFVTEMDNSPFCRGMHVIEEFTYAFPGLLLFLLSLEGKIARYAFEQFFLCIQRQANSFWHSQKLLASQFPFLAEFLFSYPSSGRYPITK